MDSPKAHVPKKKKGDLTTMGNNGIDRPIKSGIIPDKIGQDSIGITIEREDSMLVVPDWGCLIVRMVEGKHVLVDTSTGEILQETDNYALVIAWRDKINQSRKIGIK